MFSRFWFAQGFCPARRTPPVTGGPPGQFEAWVIAHDIMPRLSIRTTRGYRNLSAACGWISSQEDHTVYHAGLALVSGTFSPLYASPLHPPLAHHFRTGRCMEACRVAPDSATPGRTGASASCTQRPVRVQIWDIGCCARFNGEIFRHWGRLMRRAGALGPIR